jgi:hypothetical protein
MKAILSNQAKFANQVNILSQKALEQQVGSGFLVKIFF